MTTDVSISPLPERPSVLIVDDEALIRDILADFLGMEGYTVRTAGDGMAALEELAKNRYDLLLSDLKMPKMGGLELLDQVRLRYPHLLTVLMTGFGTVETAIVAMKRGAYDYILKPFKAEEVIRVVQRGIEKRRLEAENLRMREALSLYKVSEAIQASLSLDEVVGTLSDAALAELSGDEASVWLDDGEGGWFQRRRVFRDDAFPDATPAELGLVSPSAFIDRFRNEPIALEHGASAARYYEVAPLRPLSSLVAAPLFTSKRQLGFVVVSSFTPMFRFDEGQRKLLALIASRAAVAIENASLYEDLRQSFQQTIAGLAKAIDKMDRYTAGHSERVARYAMVLARRLGLSEDSVDVVRQSAMMHDIGKIGCVLNLNKVGKLSEDEYEAFKLHPGYGHDILEPIKFLRPLVPGVHLHHERWDGRGYPLGLAKLDIPLMARIISIADTYDAMTSDRAYRRALPHEVAMSEIDRCAGTQFDPEVADQFGTAIDEWRDAERDAGAVVPE